MVGCAQSCVFWGVPIPSSAAADFTLPCAVGCMLLDQCQLLKGSILYPFDVQMTKKSKKDEMLERMKEHQLVYEGHKDFQVSLSKMVATVDGALGDFQCRAVQQRRVMEKVKGLSTGWAPAARLTLLETDDDTYIVLDGNHRVAALRHMVAHGIRSDLFQNDMLIDVIVYKKSLPRDLALQYANWTALMQMAAHNSTVVDLLRFCHQLQSTHPGKDAASLAKVIRVDFGSEPGAAGGIAAGDNDQRLRKNLAFASAMGPEAIALAEALNDIDPVPIHQAFQALCYEATLVSDSTKPCRKALTTEKNYLACFLPAGYGILNIPWQELREAQAHLEVAKIPISLASHFMYAMWCHWIIVGKQAPDKVVRLTFDALVASANELVAHSTKNVAVAGNATIETFVANPPQWFSDRDPTANAELMDDICKYLNEEGASYFKDEKSFHANLVKLEKTLAEAHKLTEAEIASLSALLDVRSCLPDPLASSTKGVILLNVMHDTAFSGQFHQALAAANVFDAECKVSQLHGEGEPRLLAEWNKLRNDASTNSLAAAWRHLLNVVTYVDLVVVPLPKPKASEGKKNAVEGGKRRLLTPDDATNLREYIQNQLFSAWVPRQEGSEAEHFQAAGHSFAGILTAIYRETLHVKELEQRAKGAAASRQLQMLSRNVSRKQERAKEEKQVELRDELRAHAKQAVEKNRLCLEDKIGRMYERVQQEHAAIHEGAAGGPQDMKLKSASDHNTEAWGFDVRHSSALGPQLDELERIDGVFKDLRFQHRGDTAEAVEAVLLTMEKSRLAKDAALHFLVFSEQRGTAIKTLVSSGKFDLSPDYNIGYPDASWTLEGTTTYEAWTSHPALRTKPLGTHYAHIISAYPKDAGDSPKKRHAAWLSGDRTLVNRERRLMPLPSGQCSARRYSFEVDISQHRLLHSESTGRWGEENYPLALALVRDALCPTSPRRVALITPTHRR